MSILPVTYPHLRLFFDGMLLMMAVYAALSYWQQRKAVYAYYAVYILCVTVTFRYDDLEYENPNYQPGASYMVTLTETIAFALYIRFAMALMDFRRNDPPSDRLLQAMLLLLGCHTIAEALLYLMDGSPLLRSGIYVATRLVLASAALWVVPRIFRLRQPVMIYFVVGSFFFTAGCLIALWGNYVPSLFTMQRAFAFTFPISFMQLGVVLEVLCFTLGLSLRNWQSERERVAVQAELIAQLQENERKQQQLQRIRADIARDLHDDIGGDLSGISMLSQAADQLLVSQPDEARATLRLIGESARQVLTTMRQIVWSLAASPSSSDDFVYRLRETAYALFDRQPVDLHLDLPTAHSCTDLTPDMQRAVYLIYKEMLHNTMRHASARHVSVNLICTEAHLRLTVSDDGVGFNTQVTRVGSNGLTSLRQRAEDLGGHLTIRSSPGEGTTLSLTCPAKMKTYQSQPAELQE
ncbi:sensor histidine kinase [Fibrella sp. HMF5335]|uniref:Sensor histidine kinase n=1 Tax=Fibrella rubiginis TaxID=2817060 RepID=A0A939K485_9BACT|nr:sensor histidine kinase [Fibrella rubiginis]MBO0935906.1 sensor histidine kinase [Fibrella rubiginis]